MASTWSTAPMPEASDAPPALEELIDRVVTGDRSDRVRALIDAIRAGLADVRVADHRCGSMQEPYVVTFRELCRHVRDTDGPVHVALRGHRLHTTVNVVPWDPDEPGRGPGLKRGPA